jgi:predicted membrane protein
MSYLKSGKTLLAEQPSDAGVVLSSAAILGETAIVSKKSGRGKSSNIQVGPKKASP